MSSQAEQPGSDNEVCGQFVGSSADLSSSLGSLCSPAGESQVNQLLLPGFKSPDVTQV